MRKSDFPVTEEWKTQCQDWAAFPAVLTRVQSSLASLPRWQCDTQACSELQGLWLHPMEEAFPLHVLGSPSRLASWFTGQGKFMCFPYTNHYKGNRNDHDWFTPIENHSPTPGARGFASENTAMAMKRQGLTERFFTESQCSAAAVPIRRGVGFLQAAILSPHQSEISGHQCFSRLETLGEHRMCLSPRFPTRILLILLIFLE